MATRKPKLLTHFIIHCSATPKGRNVTPAQVFAWHTLPKSKGGRGWKKIGYRSIITIDGVSHKMVEVNDDKWVQDNEITNGAFGMNSVAQHICYIGGMSADNKKPENTLTPEQEKTLLAECLEMIEKHPNILIGGHNQFSDKACPSFDVPEWLEKHKIPEKNICRAVFKL